MKVTFTESVKSSANEFYLLRERAENKTLFDQAVEWMEKNKFVCNIELGSVKSKDGFVSQFTAYDWSEEYINNPHFIFYDFSVVHYLTSIQGLFAESNYRVFGPY